MDLVRAYAGFSSKGTTTEEELASVAAGSEPFLIASVLVLPGGSIISPKEVSKNSVVVGIYLVIYIEWQGPGLEEV